MTSRFSRSSSTNLVAIARDAPLPPTVWLVAHLDSKSQSIPMLVRIASIAVFSIAFIVLALLVAALAIMHVAGLEANAALFDTAGVVSILASLSLIPIALCFVGDRSNGALDNASGVATVLLAAQQLRQSNVAILITSAEELGLAGARAFAGNGAAGIAINCDTIDDHGSFICMKSGEASEKLEPAIARASSLSGVEVRKARSGRYLRPMLPGVLADNIALTDAGWESFTLSRGNLRTLALVHTSSDRAETVDGTGIAEAVQLVVAIAKELS